MSTITDGGHRIGASGDEKGEGVSLKLPEISEFILQTLLYEIRKDGVVEDEERRVLSRILQVLQVTPERFDEIDRLVQQSLEVNPSLGCFDREKFFKTVANMLQNCCEPGDRETVLRQINIILDEGEGEGILASHDWLGDSGKLRSHKKLPVLSPRVATIILKVTSGVFGCCAIFGFFPLMFYSLRAAESDPKSTLLMTLVYVVRGLPVWSLVAIAVSWSLHSRNRLWLALFAAISPLAPMLFVLLVYLYK